MMKLRRQVYELRAEDFAIHPIWEFALDEEGEEGQDEATVRPWEGTPPLDPNDGMFVVRAEFTLGDGTVCAGYLTPPVQGETSIGTIQPIIMTENGQVMFWCGLAAPTAESIERAYRMLERSVERVFPIRYSSVVNLVGGAVSGTIKGFMHLRSFEDRTVVETR